MPRILCLPQNAEKMAQYLRVSMKHTVETSTFQASSTFTEWLKTHEGSCRRMVHITCARCSGVMRSIALEPDDVWGDVVLKLQRKNPVILNEAALMKLVKTCSKNHILDRGRKNRTRQSVFAESFEIGDESRDVSSAQLREFDPEKSHQPDHLLAEADGIIRLREIALGDPGTARVFEAICFLEEQGIAPSLSNLSQHLSSPYAAIRRSRLRLQQNVRRAFNTDCKTRP